MSLLDRLLPLWILLAMVTGLLLGRLIPGLDTFLERYVIPTFQRDYEFSRFSTGNEAAPCGLRVGQR